jgi:hypothetical protein
MVKTDKKTIANKKTLLFFFIAINFILNFYGNTWGLPYRWHSDEAVANVLHMAQERSLIDPIGEFLHFTGYQLFLLIALVPYYIYLKLAQYPLEGLRQAASVSWFYMANQFPDFASNIYIYARGLSALLGSLTVYIIYLMGKELYDEKAGLFSAAFLSVSMGFIGFNHFAKYISLVNLLIALTLLLSLIALGRDEKRGLKRLFYFASFCGGLAFSVHFNALLLTVPLFLTFIFSFIKIKKEGEKDERYFYKGDLKTLMAVAVIATGFYILGFISGTPSIITHFTNYFSAFTNIFRGNIAPEGMGSQNWYSVFIGPLNYLIEMAVINGFLIFLIIVLGMMQKVYSWKRISQKEIIVFSFIFLYYFTITVLFEDKYPDTKHIIAIIPLLVIFAGKVMADTFQSEKIPVYFKHGIFLLIFFYSLAYSYKGDLVFKNGDTRYQSTRWIYSNVQKGLKIEVLDQLHYVASLGIMNDYNIIYLGRNSKHFNGKYFFKWDKAKEREEHFRYINKYDSKAEYIVIDLDDINKIYLKNYMPHIPGLSQYIRNLFENKKNFKLVRIIKPTNQKTKSEKIKGLIYPENIFWDPIPSYRVTANTIYIFKRIKGKNA